MMKYACPRKEKMMRSVWDHVVGMVSNAITSILVKRQLSHVVCGEECVYVFVGQEPFLFSFSSTICIWREKHYVSNYSFWIQHRRFKIR